MAVATGIADHEQAVSPTSVLFALGVLTANLFYQRSEAPCFFYQQRFGLPELLKIEASTYRILRLLPFVAIIDASGCLLTLVLFWRECWNRAPDTGTSIARNLAGKPELHQDASKQGFVSSAQNHIKLPSKPSPKYLLALGAILQLFKLTVYKGISFSAFCGWALFLSYFFSEILDHYAPDFLGDWPADEAGEPTRNSKPERLARRNRFRWSLLVVLTIALVFESIHLIWLGQYLVPRTLWMGWEPLQMAPIDLANTTFFALTGMSASLDTSLGQEAEDLIVGFQPYNTIFGSFFYLINATIGGLVIFMSTLVLLVPYIVSVIVLVYLIEFGTIGGLIYLIYQASDHPIVSGPVSWVGTSFNYVSQRINTLPPQFRFYLKIAKWMSLVAGVLLLGIGYLLVLSLPMYMLKIYDFGVASYGKWYEHVIDPLYLSIYNRPEGSYTAMAGVLLPISTTVFRNEGIPLIARKSWTSVSKDERRYWTAVWSVAMLCVLSVFYYGFCFDATGTRRPSWSWWFIL